MKKLLAILLLTVSSVAFANDAMKLNCRVDTVPGISTPREITLRDGMREDVSCNIDSCRDKDLTITMNYNSLYSQVSLSVWDTNTDQAIETAFPNLKKGSMINFTVYKSKSSRFLRIACDVEQM